MRPANDRRAPVLASPDGDDAWLAARVGGAPCQPLLPSVSYSDPRSRHSRCVHHSPTASGWPAAPAPLLRPQPMMPGLLGPPASSPLPPSPA